VDITAIILDMEVTMDMGTPITDMTVTEDMEDTETGTEATETGITMKETGAKPAFAMAIIA